jgi:hypothetical protein
MSLSPHEVKVLAELEEDLRTEDPVLAAALRQGPPSSFSPSRPPISVGRGLALVGALTALAVLVTAYGDRLGVGGLAILSVVAVVPWLVAAVLASEHGSRSPRGEHLAAGRTRPSRAKRGALVAAAALVASGVLLPPTWFPALVAVVAIAALAAVPHLVARAAAGVDRREGSSRPGAPA